MAVEYRPLKDYIVVERAIDKGTVVLPEKSDPASDEVFRVLAVGPGREGSVMDVSEGDLVCIVGYINTFNYKGTKAILARAAEVIAVVEEKEE
jgi:co-chaperonin GroES (HSP10)